MCLGVVPSDPTSGLLYKKVELLGCEVVDLQQHGVSEDDWFFYRAALRVVSRRDETGEST